MEGIAQIYRIVSFLVLGVLLIGSAYLYNKAEGWLKTTGTEPGAPTVKS
jgi:hypothetical protein